MIRSGIVVLSVLLAAALECRAQGDTVQAAERRAWLVRTQFAGYQGLWSIGGGPVLAKGVWRPMLMYGHAPANDQRQSVQQVILRNDIVFLPRDRHRTWGISPTTSLGVMQEFGIHTYHTLPDKYPKDYYAAPKPHVTWGIGGRFERGTAAGKAVRAMAFTMEAVALDTYLWYAVSQRGFPVYAAYGLSFGFELEF